MEEYWKEEYYTDNIFEGTHAEVESQIRNEFALYPNMEYGTRLFELNTSGSQRKVIVTRFKTKDLCRKHALYPTTEAREGKVL